MPAHTDTAIIGAGPYGLSIAAHLQTRGLDYRIFGSPMYAWIKQMPKGMLLKSEGFHRTFTIRMGNSRWDGSAKSKILDMLI